jgi:hypothetical protein
MQRQLCAVLLSFALCSCTAIAPLPPYVPSDGSQTRSHASDLKGVALGSFSSDVDVHPICRGGWSKISPGGEQTFEGYIRHAFADELKLAGKEGGARPRVVLTGHVERLEFSSILDWLSRGYWDIELRVDSSNGHTLTVEHRTEIETGYHDVPACEKVAAQYPVAVQALIGALLSNPDFPSLVE